MALGQQAAEANDWTTVETHFRTAAEAVTEDKAPGPEAAAPAGLAQVLLLQNQPELHLSLPRSSFGP